MARNILIWAALAAALLGPLAVAATSPQLAWRGPVYIASGFAGVIALGLLLVQPLLIGGHLPGLRGRPARRWHGWIGGALVVAVAAHVGGLWITSAPDVIDALLFRSPTPFSDWGVIAMWSVFAAAFLALLRRRHLSRPALWRLMHAGLALIVVIGSVVHAVLIEGTMGTVSKLILCGLVIAAMVKLLHDLRPWRALPRRKA